MEHAHTYIMWEHVCTSNNSLVATPYCSLASEAEEKTVSILFLLANGQCSLLASLLSD